MRARLFFRTTTTLFCFLFLSFTLTSCGGESQADSTRSINTPSLPTQITKSNWKNTNLRAKSNNTFLHVDDMGKRLKITITYPGFLTTKNTQIFIDADNNKQTGFSFDDEAWGLIGADYIIENGSLFKSLTSGTENWDWDYNSPPVESYKESANKVEIIIKKNNLGSPCNTINIGIMGRDDSWDIDVMYPVSNSLSTFNIDSCVVTSPDTVKPKITLLGSNPMSIVRGTVFNDPGATATDNVDGNISNSITSTNTIDITRIGTYKVVYKVSDAAGNSTQFNRRVNIINAPTSNGITVDGNTSDWDVLIDTAYTKLIKTTSKTFLAIQDAQKNNIYLLMKWDALATSDNVQIYLDTDNNPNTGYQVWDDALQRVVSGAEYIIENESLNKYTGSNGYDWSWQNNVHAIEFVHLGNVAEMQLPASIAPTQKLGIVVYRTDPTWSNYHLFVEKMVYSKDSGATVKKFSHIKMHNELLNSQHMIWNEHGEVQVIDITSHANKGSSTLKVASTTELQADQLLVYQVNDHYYVSQISSVPSHNQINLVKPLEGAIPKGSAIWNFYANASHPNRYGYRAIADFMIKSQNLGANTTGKHVLFGDSWFSQSSFVEERLKQKLPAATIINEGVGGNTSQDLINRFDSDVIPHHPSTIWLITGTNDYWLGISTEQFKENLQILIKKSAAIGAKLMIIDSSVGTGTGASGVENHKQSNEYVNALIELY